MSKINRTRRSELVTRCAPMLLAHARSLVDDPEQSKDIFQEAILKLLSDPELPEELSRLVEHGRRMTSEIARGAPLLSSESPLLDDPLDPWLDPERAADTREELERAVHNLGDEARELLVRRYVLGENARELSSGRPQSPAAVRVRLMRLRSAARAAR